MTGGQKEYHTNVAVAITDRRKHLVPICMIGVRKLWPPTLLFTTS